MLAEEGHIGGWAVSLSEMTATCPLSSFEQRIAAVDDTCTATMAKWYASTACQNHVRTLAAEAGLNSSVTANR